jgi:hypothetical protein
LSFLIRIHKKITKKRFCTYNTVTKPTKVSVEHYRLGHISNIALNKLDLLYEKGLDLKYCEICLESNIKSKINRSTLNATDKTYRITLDIVELIKPSTILNNDKYIITLLRYYCLKKRFRCLYRLRKARKKESCKRV